jgi:hypothetical protein
VEHVSEQLDQLVLASHGVTAAGDGASMQPLQSWGADSVGLAAGQPHCAGHGVPIVGLLLSQGVPYITLVLASLKLG